MGTRHSAPTASTGSDDHLAMRKSRLSDAAVQSVTRSGCVSQATTHSAPPAGASANRQSIGGSGSMPATCLPIAATSAAILGTGNPWPALGQYDTQRGPGKPS